MNCTQKVGQNFSDNFYPFFVFLYSPLLLVAGGCLLLGKENMSVKFTQKLPLCLRISFMLLFETISSIIPFSFKKLFKIASKISFSCSS